MKTAFKTYTYDSGISGPNLLVTGAIHGNETCGPKAIARLMREFNLSSGASLLSSGSLTLIPVSNPEAYKARRRHIGGDLNRNLAPVSNPETRLDYVRNELCAELRKCDVLLDLHSLFCSQVAFAYVGPYDSIEREYAANLGVGHVVEGWEGAYEKSNYPVPATQSTGTTEFARQFGAIAVTLECGNHADPNAPYVGLRAAIGALSFFEMIDVPKHLESISTEAIVPRDELICAKMDRVYYQLEDGVISNLQNFDRIAKGDILAVNANGTTINAEDDGYIIMPDPRMTKAPAKGEQPEEWFYTAVPSQLLANGLR